MTHIFKERGPDHLMIFKFEAFGVHAEGCGI